MTERRGFLLRVTGRPTVPASFYFYAFALLLAVGLDGVLAVGWPVWALVASGACAVMFVLRSFADSLRDSQGTRAATPSAKVPTRAVDPLLPGPQRTQRTG